MSNKRRRYESEEEPEPFSPEEEEPEPFWREEGVPHNLPKSYGRTNDFFTIKMRGGGRFMKFGRHQVYSGGWVRYLDYCQGCRLTIIWLMYVLRQMGLTGICFLYYKKPMTYVVEFALNLVVFLLVGKTSALTMNVAGVVKDWLLIAFSWSVIKDTVTPINLAGYGVAFLGVAYYNHAKLQALKVKDAQKASQTDEEASNLLDQKQGENERRKDDFQG